MGSYAISVSGLSTPADLDITIYTDNAFTQTLCSTSATSTSGDSVTCLLNSNTYYIKVNNYTNNATVNYTLSSAWVGDGTPQYPTTLPAGGGSLNGKVGYSSSYSNVTYSYYVVYSLSAGSHGISVSSLSPAADIDIYVYSDSTFTTLTTSATNTGTASETLTYTFTAGTYYIKVKNYTNSANVTYTIQTL